MHERARTAYPRLLSHCLLVSAAESFDACISVWPRPGLNADERQSVRIPPLNFDAVPSDRPAKTRHGGIRARRVSRRDVRSRLDLDDDSAASSGADCRRSQVSTWGSKGRGLVSRFVPLQNMLQKFEP